jgi:tRNA(fMet)-specific endonuclease VapC
VADRYLLDTNMVRAILNGDANVAKRVLATPFEDIFLSIVAVEEMTRGRLAELNDARENKSKLSLETAYTWFLETLYLVHRFQILNYTDVAEAAYRDFPASLKRIGRQDCRIAAQALTENLIVITRNTEHFSQVVGLHCEDWTQP